MSPKPPATERQPPKIDFDWAVPPPRPSSGRGRSPNPRLIQASDTLRDHPGKWARVAAYAKASSASALVGRILTGKAPFEPKGDFEAVSREGVVYARFVGAVEQIPEGESPDDWEHVDDWESPARNGGIDDWPND